MHGSEAHSLGQNRWKICIPLPPLPSPPIKDGKLARFGFCAASSLICGVGGGGGMGVCCSILFGPRLQVQSAEEGGWS